MSRAIVLAAVLLLSVPSHVTAQAEEEPDVVLIEESVYEVQDVYEVQEAPAPLARPLTIPELIDAAAYRWGVSAARMRCIAWRESTYRPWATSPGGHRGLFQFADQTYRWASWNAGVGGSSPYDPYAAAESAGWLMSQGGWNHWSVERFCR
ncbi:MAG TPA: transglycosylase SLT domain-containing protein [Chloroflexota bacterium]|nr:transglycosylase SLT domain-containing protein [Chloroflexota bacterium]